MPDLKVEIRTEIDAKLCEWGKWARGSVDGNCYPNQTPFRRLMGGQIGQAVMSDEEAVRIDAAITALGRHDKEAKEFAVTHYVKGVSCYEMKNSKIGIGKTKALKLRDYVISFVSDRIFSENS